jgi:heme oxygenase
MKPESVADNWSVRGHAHGCLRAATAPLHKTLDRRLVPSLITNREGYLRYLLTNFPCVSIELGLSAACIHRLLPDWHHRERRFALADDLLGLGVRPRPVEPLAFDNDIGTILGWSYVLEGSRLGACQILRMVDASGNPEICAATRFLRHGESKDLWGGFKEALSMIDNDAPAIAKACTAAETAFQCFIAASDSKR